MDKNKTCYLFFDYDGTVFTDGKYAEENVLAMQKAQSFGHKLILNTGRSRGGLDLSGSEEAGIHWDGTIFGGEDIRYLGVQYPTDPLDPKYGIRWVKYCMKHHVKLYLECEKKNLRLEFHKHPEKFTFSERRKYIREAKRFMKGNPLTKFTYHHLDLNANDFPKSPIYFIDMDIYQEAYKIGKDKGGAIREFCRLTGADLEQCICFGDSRNDVGMFRVAPTRVAMAHSPEMLKKMATFTATGDFGVAEGIEWLLKQ